MKLPPDIISMECSDCGSPMARQAECFVCLSCKVRLAYAGNVKAHNNWTVPVYGRERIK